MNKRFAAVPPTILGILVSLAIVGGVLGVRWLGSEETVISETPSAGAGVLRFRSVTINLPSEQSPLRLTPVFPPGPQTPRFLIQIYAKDSSTGESPAEIQIDADTGEVISDDLSQIYPGESRALLQSLRVDADPPEVWPYSDRDEPLENDQLLGDLEFALPPTASGVYVFPTVGRCVVPPPGCVPETLLVHNGRSQMHIRADTGEVETFEAVLPEDREAFERYASSVSVAAADVTATP